MDGDIFSIIFENKSNMLDITALREGKEKDHERKRELGHIIWKTYLKYQILMKGPLILQSHLKFVEVAFLR